MKIQTWRILGFSLTMLCCSCLHESASDTTKSPEIAVLANTPVSTNILSTNAMATNILVEIETGTTNAAESSVQSTPISLAQSPGMNEIIQLCQARIDESVILAHIRGSNIPYNPTADEIIYLNDIGIPSQIVTAIIQRGATVREDSKAPGNPASLESAQTTNAEPANPPPPASPAVVLPEPTPQAATASTETIYETSQATEQPDVTVNQFYTALSPYGTWVDVPEYGMSWQPSVVVTQPQWRPYCDSGRWLYTDCGWYWQSDYSWGWAPFHYGRWYRHAHRGWLWCPDTTWGPSWVSWRRSPIHCGWAPLPPHARYLPGHGFSYHGMMVGSDFGFSLGVDDFTFVSYNHFSHRNPYRYYLHRKEADAIYSKTTIVNNYRQGPGNIPGNHGIDRDQVARISRTEIRKIAVRDMPPAAGKIVKPDRVERDGNNWVLYRPTGGNPDAGMQAPAPRTEARKGPVSGTKPGALSGASVAVANEKPAALTPRENDARSERPQLQPPSRPSSEPMAARPVGNSVPITRIPAPQPQKRTEERATQRPAPPATAPAANSLAELKPALPPPTPTPPAVSTARQGSETSITRPAAIPNAASGIRAEPRKTVTANPRTGQETGLQPARPAWASPPSAADLTRQPRMTTLPSPSGNGINNASPGPALPNPTQSPSSNPNWSRQEIRSARPIEANRTVPAPNFAPRQPAFTPSQPAPRPATPAYTPPSVQSAPRVAPTVSAPAPSRSYSAPASTPPPPSSRPTESPRSAAPSPSKQDASKERK